MIHFHPTEDMLVEYAAGSLDQALAISIKAHIEMCPECREKVSRYNQLGATLMMNEEVEHADEAEGQQQSFADLMTRIKSTSANEQARFTPTAKPKNTTLPAVLDALLPARSKLKWRRVSPSLKQANLATGQNQYEVCLHKISKGGKVAHHDHRGLEVTLVLSGAFSDENGTYKKGDFVVRQPGERHRPCATQNQDCLCLSVVAAPVKLTGFMGTLINPLLRFNPA